MALSGPQVIRAARPLVRLAVSGSGNRLLRALAPGPLHQPQRAGHSLPSVRHPLSPAALRVERWRSVRKGRRSDHTALTVWFGEGPALPAPAASDPLRTVLRVGTGVVGAAALATMSVLAARAEARARVIDAPAEEHPPERLDCPTA